jgi:hypothetical protein
VRVRWVTTAEKGMMWRNNRIKFRGTNKESIGHTSHGFPWRQGTEGTEEREQEAVRFLGRDVGMEQESNGRE